jgi:hypothetical protein
MAITHCFDSEEFLRRAKAAQCLQSCSRLRGRWLGAGSRYRAGFPGFRCSKLDRSSDRSPDRDRFSDRTRSRLGVRINARRIEAHERCRRDAVDAAEEAHMDLHRCHLRRDFGDIIFPGALHGRKQNHCSFA